MCTNRALVDSLECYMDDLVDCFEDFVKKSVIVISVAVGLLVAMIAYVLKTIVDRTPPTVATGEVARRSSQNLGNRNVFESNFMFDSQDNKETHTNPAPAAENQTQDEKDMKDVGFSGCPKLNCGLSATRISLPSLRIIKKCSFPKICQKTSIDDGKRKSCCSMCCEEMCQR